MNFNNFTIKAQETVQKAIDLAQAGNQQMIEPTHVLKGVMLVAPLFAQWQNDADKVLSRARASFPTAVVIGTDDAACNFTQAQHIAAQLGGKALQSPHSGHLDSELAGWQWGMKLMQEMILA